MQSLSSRRAWIEIIYKRSILYYGKCRSPHGERGLKWEYHYTAKSTFKRRSPHGERGLKYFGSDKSPILLRRSPHGERGLKYKDTDCSELYVAVALLTESVD